MRLALIALVCALPALSAAGETEDSWLAGLQDAVAADLLAGKPLVVQVHVPLCSNEILRCGGLGDGDNPAKNLYWEPSGAFLGWFNRKGSGWKQVLVLPSGAVAADVLDVRVWKKTQSPGGALKARGVTARFDVYVVAWAWRGTKIDDTVAAFVADTLDDAPRSVTLADGTVIDAGGAARIVAIVGHNRWMDYESFDWATRKAAATGTRQKGIIAEACHTAAYLAAPLSGPTRIPLMMTADYLYAGAHAFEGAVSSFARGEGYKAIRLAAAQSYADGEEKDVKKVGGAFTNPGDKRWKRWLEE
jgi:hypothetical protein